MNPTSKLCGPLAAIALTIPATLYVDGGQDPIPRVAKCAKPKVVRWCHGDEPIRLLPADKGFCFVSGMGGDFQGGGEGVRVFAAAASYAAVLALLGYFIGGFNYRRLLTPR